MVSVAFVKNEHAKINLNRGRTFCWTKDVLLFIQDSWKLDGLENCFDVSLLIVQNLLISF